jgi:hypothetical protein
VTDRVELLATGTTPELEQRVQELGGTTARNEDGVLITVSVAYKREIAESLWAANLDVLHILPVRSSLEELYLQTVGTESGVV